VKIYRLTRSKYSKKLSGKGSAIKGGRWNSVGVELIYCAENRSLAIAEIAVHFSLATLPNDYIMLTIEINSSIKIKEIKEKNLPDTWNEFPPIKQTQEIGDNFVNENKCAVCRIPSVVTKGDYNYLINPKHRDFFKIKISTSESFPFDKRLFR